MQFTPPPFSLQHVDYNLLTSKLLCAGAGNGTGPGIQVFIMYKEYFKKEKNKLFQEDCFVYTMMCKCVNGMSFIISCFC